MSIQKEHRKFLLRRLHSLSGIVPIGGFLLMHLYENSHALLGEQAYNEMVARIHAMPLLLSMEIFLIWLPILFHGVYGFVLAFGGKSNVSKYPQYFNNWMYTFQRWSGMLTFAFILWHFWGTWMQSYLYGDTVGFSMMSEIVSSPWQMAFYILGVGAAIYHLSNGVWTFGITWGILVGPRSQKVVHFVCLLAGLALYIVSLRTLFAFKV